MEEMKTEKCKICLQERPIKYFPVLSQVQTTNGPNGQAEKARVRGSNNTKYCCTFPNGEGKTCKQIETDRLFESRQNGFYFL